jgi:hypothetical protein
MKLCAVGNLKHAFHVPSLLGEEKMTHHVKMADARGKFNKQKLERRQNSLNFEARTYNFRNMNFRLDHLSIMKGLLHFQVFKTRLLVILK